MNNILVIFIFFNIILSVLVVYGFIKYRSLFRAYDRFMRGKTAESLENTIEKMFFDIKKLEEEDEINKKFMREINKNHRASFQKLGIVKYNALKGMGGNMSFAIALLDYTDSGFIINSLHSHEGNFSYLKIVDRARTDLILSPEEKEALEQALGYVERKE